jgi:CubicO group peptidase (beta-lactamase class C family)
MLALCEPCAMGGQVITIEISRSGIDFSPLHERMQWYIDEGILSCCNTLVMRGLDVVDFKTFGYMDLETRRPLTDDAIYRMYSNTKLVTSVAAMMLFEKGLFALDDPLASYLPEFADIQVLKPGATDVSDVEPATSPILMRHILSHSAGLSYGFIEPQSLIDRAYAAAGINVPAKAGETLETLCGKLARLPLAYHPGTDWRYSFATDVTARVVEVLSGMRFDEFLETHIFEPLAMVDTGFYVPADKAVRFITMYAPEDLLDPMKSGLVKADDAFEGQYNQPRTMLSGGGGLVSTVSDYLSFLRMLINGGEYNGARILTPETLALMRTNQLADGVGVRFPTWKMPDTVFGLGFALKQAVSDNEPGRALDEYHWGGMAGTHSWMAPQANIAGMCMTQRMPGFWHPFSHEFKTMAYSLTE